MSAYKPTPDGDLISDEKLEEICKVKAHFIYEMLIVGYRELKRPVEFHEFMCSPVIDIEEAEFVGRALQYLITEKIAEEVAA